MSPRVRKLRSQTGNLLLQMIKRQQVSTYLLLVQCQSRSATRQSCKQSLICLVTANHNRSLSTETFDFPVAKSQLTGNIATQVLREDIQLSPKGFPVTVRNKTCDTWRPPDAWKCPTSPEGVVPLKPPTTPNLRSRTSKERKAMSSISELTHLRRSIRRMEAASAKIMLERLREEWNEVADAAVYRELELEKQLWMLCALRSLNKKKDLNKTTSVSSEKSAEPAKVLSLFENHGLSPDIHLKKRTNISQLLHHFSPRPRQGSRFTICHLHLYLQGPTLMSIH